MNPSNPYDLPSRPAPASIGADVRYASAWGEITTRITQRQNLISIYTTLAVAATGAAMAALNRSAPPSPQAVGLLSEWSYLIAWRLVYAVPLLSLLFSALLYMHERQLGILRAYVAYLENFDPSIASYHGESRYSMEAQRTRNIHDWTCLGLSVGMNLCAFLIYSYAWHVRLTTEVDSVFIWVLIAVFALSVWQICRLGHQRNAIYQRLSDGGGHIVL